MAIINDWTDKNYVIIDFNASKKKRPNCLVLCVMLSTCSVRNKGIVFFPYG